MQRPRTLGTVLLVLLALSTVGSSSASAVQLPEFTVATSFKGTDGAYMLTLAGTVVKCTSSTNTTTLPTANSGLFTLYLLGCKSGGQECHSLGDAAESLLLAGTYTLLRLAPGEPGIEWRIGEVHLECALLSLLLVVRGVVLGQMSPWLTKTTKFSDEFKVKESKQEVTAYENDAGEKVSVTLEGSLNAGAFKAATDEDSEFKLTAEKETEIIKTN